MSSSFARVVGSPPPPHDDPPKKKTGFINYDSTVGCTLASRFNIPPAVGGAETQCMLYPRWPTSTKNEDNSLAGRHVCLM